MKEQASLRVTDKIWVEKLLCESDKAYHIWGKIFENDQLHSFWVPKSALIHDKKKFKGEIDYSKYDHRPPLSHQKLAIETLLANNKFILADDMGLGKTTSSVIASIESKAKKILIICPASLKINWQREIEQYSDKKVFIVTGRRWKSDHDYYIINYDILKNFHTLDEDKKDNEGKLIEDFNEIKIIEEMGFDLVIIDEAHYISNTTAKRTKIVNEIVKNIPKIWLLTGTPMTSRPINYFNLLNLVDSPLATNWQTYVVRYCAGYRFPVGGGKKVWSTTGASHLSELREATQHLILRRLKTDVLDLPDKIISPILLELLNTEYDEELEEFMRITNSEKGKESISVTLNRLMPIRQIIANEKIQYTKEIIDKYLENDKKVIVFTNFTSTLENLHELYPKNSVILDGRMDTTRKQKSVDAFQDDPKIRIFIANLKAGGVGHNLTKAECVIMNDLCFVPSDHSQGEDRAFRYGQKKNVNVYYPIFDNTIERIVYNILIRKKDNIDEVMGDGEYSKDFATEFMRELNI